MDLWYGSVLDIPNRLIQDLFEYTTLMKDFVIFSPRIITFQCPNCIGEVRDRVCLSQGLYCVTPPKDEVGRYYPRVTDHQLLKENLRSKCLFMVTNEMGGTDQQTDELKFFNFLYNLRYDCANGPDGIGDDCI